jgi:hypothetical protein
MSTIVATQAARTGSTRRARTRVNALAIVAAVGAIAALAPTIPAAQAGAGGVRTTPLPSARTAAFDELPLRLPRGGAVAARAGRDWLIGTRATATATRLVRAAGGRRLPVHGTWRVPIAGARGLAHRLQARGLLVWAQDNPILRRQASFDGQEGAWARAAVVPPTLAPPTAGVPIGIVDDFVDPQNPDVGAQTRHVNTPPGVVAAAHGTQVASVAAGASNSTGVVGVLPGAPILSYGLTDSTCADVVQGIGALVSAGARVINLSLGSTEPCAPLYLAVTDAYARGIIVVAAAGNEFQQGNPVVYPAAYPHVLSVAAVKQDLRPASFSSANAAVDLAAPGEGVPVSLPAALDVDDGVQDGITLADGTSFSAPMVAGAAAWLATTRPSTAPAQIADLLRRSATDLGAPGWDRDTGYGLLNVAAAVAAPDPPADPLEPNDAIPFVDGTAFGTPDPPVWRGAGRRTFSATVDAVEDPVDVYRVRIPARAQIAVALTPRHGDPDLYAFDRSAKTFDDRPVAASRRGPGRKDTVRLVNPGNRARTAYIAVEAPTVSSATFDASYQLDFRRQRGR